MRAPCWTLSRASTSAALSVISTRLTIALSLLDKERRRGSSPRLCSILNLEEAQRLGRIAHQDVLRVLIVLEHHLVVFATNTRLLVAAKSSVRRIGVIAIRPYAAGLNLASELVGTIAISGPHACAEAVKRVVGDCERVRFVLELRDRNDRSEDLFLEDAHLVVAFENRRFDVIAFGKFALEFRALAAGEHLCTLLLADVEIRQNLLKLVVGGLCADHGCGVKRMALLYFLCPRDRSFHEFVIDRFLHQRAARD